MVEQPRLWPVLLKRAKPDISRQIAAALERAEDGDLIVVAVERAPGGTVHIHVGDKA